MKTKQYRATARALAIKIVHSWQGQNNSDEESAHKFSISCGTTFKMSFMGRGDR